jgi:hypothetical protein
MKARLLSFVALVALVGGACGNPLGATAQFANVDDELKVFALSGTPLAVPTALVTVTHQVVRAESGANFDIVFDITSAGQAVVYPSVTVGLTGRTGIIKSATPYKDLLLAPPSNYNDTTATAINAGDVIVVRASSIACQGALNPYVFSKIAVDSINLGTRTISFHMRVDPNCGFRSFADGIPRQ